MCVCVCCQELNGPCLSGTSAFFIAYSAPSVRFSTQGQQARRRGEGGGGGEGKRRHFSTFFKITQKQRDSTFTVNVSAVAWDPVSSLSPKKNTKNGRQSLHGRGPRASASHGHRRANTGQSRPAQTQIVNRYSVVASRPLHSKQTVRIQFGCIQRK